MAKAVTPAEIRLSDDNDDKAPKGTAAVRKVARASKRAAKPAPKKGKQKGGFRKGSLDNKYRPHRDPGAVFEIMLQGEGGFGAITGRLNKKFKLGDITKAARVLSSKKQLNLRRFKSVDIYAMWVVREMLRRKIVKLVKRGAPVPE